MSNQESARGTLTDGVAAAITQRIAARSLTPGAQLPSIRACAAAMRVSTSTVVEAYDRLAAQGVIRSRRGAGFYVTGPLAPLSLAEIGPRLDREIDPLWVSRQALDAGTEVLTPGCGWLPSSWMPEASLRRALRTAARGPGARLTDYGSPQGLPALRALLARRMGEHGIAASPEQIMLTESGTQALDLVCRLLLARGDTVLVDDPCYFNFHALLRAHQVKVIGVPYTPSGPDMQRFAEAVAEHSPRLYVTNSAVHNPTGATLSPVIAHRVLKLAEQSGMAIVEDDIFADFEHTPSPRLAAFDGLDRVIHISSFSKALSASIRCGFVAARPDWIERLVDLRIATSFGGGLLAPQLVLSLLSDGSYRKHMEGLRVRLSRAMDETAARLRMLGIEPWLMPQAGMFLWCRLPDGLEATGVARACLVEGIVLAPGNVFSLAHTAGNYIRFNVAQSSDERVFTALAKAMHNTLAEA